MYEKNNRSSAWGSHDEFLRRMLGGELPGRSLPTMNRPEPTPVDQPETEAENGQGTGSGCCRYPSLAMVYAPEQKWKDLLSLDDALDEGTLFRELVKPFEGRSVYHGNRG